MKLNDVVFTNHSIDRMKERGITGDWVWQTVRQPDKTTPGKEKYTTEFKKRFGSHLVTAISKKNDIGEWVVLSVWMDPPLKGTKDYYDREKYLSKLEKGKKLTKRMEHASFWEKLWLTFRKQIGL